jgi:hypothetical protein
MITDLLVIDTEVEGEKKSGFYKSMGNYLLKLGSKKPIPKRLQLKPEHVAWMGVQISFTAAKFNTGGDSKEQSIVTSSGPFVISWNFNRVKLGYLFPNN